MKSLTVFPVLLHIFHESGSVYSLVGEEIVSMALASTRQADIAVFAGNSLLGS